MKVQGKRASLGSTFTVPPNPDPRARMCELEQQKVGIEAEIVKAARECLALAESSVSVATMQIAKWQAAKVDRLAEVARLERLVASAPVVR